MNIVEEKYKISNWTIFDEKKLAEKNFIVVLHANRIPPHIGMIIGGYYNSLTIKGADTKVSVEVLLKTIRHRLIPSLFIEIYSPESSNEIYLMNRFIDKINLFKRVDVNVATCLTPLKLFFEDEFSISMNDIDYLYQLLPRLDENKLIKNVSSLYLDSDNYELPVYSDLEISEQIKKIRAIYK